MCLSRTHQLERSGGCAWLRSGHTLLALTACDGGGEGARDATCEDAEGEEALANLSSDDVGDMGDGGCKGDEGCGVGGGDGSVPSMDSVDAHAEGFAMAEVPGPRLTDGFWVCESCTARGRRVLLEMVLCGSAENSGGEGDGDFA